MQFYICYLFLTSNMNCVGIAFDVNASGIVSDDFNEFRSFLIFSNSSVVNVDLHFNVDNYLNRKFYDHDFNQNLGVTAKKILMFYYIVLKHSHELRIKIFKFVVLILVLNVMKYLNHSEVYDGMKTCGQLHIFTYESVKTSDTVETSCLHSGLAFFLISKLQYRNSNSCFNLLLLLSGDISLNPEPPHNNQLQPQSEWRGLHFIHLNVKKFVT